MTTVGGGRYELTDRIAAGGMGEVWKGRDTALSRTVAVKLLHSSLADDARFRARFESEARNAAALHEPTIATIFDYGDDVDSATGSHTAYLVMEYVDGVPMSDLLTSPLPPARAASLVAQVADGLAVAHAAGIVHRDVKPANFLVTGNDRVKITDFGIARARGAVALTDSGLIMGTPYYVPPEVAEGREATPASDLYSLGVVLHEALTGRRPFTGETPVAVVLAHLRDDPPPLPASVPPKLVSLVASAMAKDPAQRPPSAARFAAALRSAAGNDAAAVAVPGSSAATALLPSAARATQALPQASAPPDVAATPRRRWWPALALAVALLLIAGFSWALMSGDDPGSGDRKPVAGSGQSGQPGSSTAQQNTTPATTTATSPQPTTPTTPLSTPPTGITFDPARIIGADEEVAEASLESLDLDVDTEDVSGGVKDIVADVSPTSGLAPGDQVTLFVYDGKSSKGGPEPGSGGSNGKSKGRG